MSDRTPFTDPEKIEAMEEEHRPLWKAFIRLLSPLLVPGVRIMDFGCSRGGLLLLIFDRASRAPARTGPSCGLGLDLDVPPVRSLLAEAAGSTRGRVPILFSTGGPGSFPGQFDLVVSHEVVYLLPDLRRTFTEIHSALAPGGHFCLCTGCHRENPLFPYWRKAFADEGVVAYERGVEEYEEALRQAGFVDVARDRLLLSQGEFEVWTKRRASPLPNPAWFPDAPAERRYYTETGKLVLNARKG